MKQHSGFTDEISSADFFRREDHAYAKKRIERGESYMITAVPGVGTSSFLRVLKERLDADNNIQAALLDLNQISVGSAEVFFEAIFDALTELSSIQKETMFELADEIGRDNSKTYVILVDRFEKAIKNTPSEFFDAVRALVVNSKRNVVFIFAADIDLDTARPYDEIEQLYTLIGSFTYYLQPLKEKDSIYFIRQRGELKEADLTEKQVQAIHKETGGHGRLINAHIDHLSEHPDTKTDEAFFDNSMHFPDIAFHYKRIFDHLDLNEETTLRKISLGHKLTDSDYQDVHYLKQIGLIVDDETVFSDGISRYIRYTSTPTDTGLTFNSDTGEFYINANRLDAKLSAREFVFLQYMYEHRNQVVERDAIVEKVWQAELREGVSDEAVDQLVSRLREKIEIDKRNPQYLITIRGRGFQLKTE